MKKFILIFFCFPFLFLSCEKKDKNKNVLKFCFHNEPQTLDTRKNGDYFSSTLQFMLYRGLMHINGQGELVPALAKSYVISEDKKTYIFYLKDNIKWSDGNEITAQDFEKSWKSIIDPNFPALASNLLYPIKNAEKIAKKELSKESLKVNSLDDKTLIVELENPTPYFLFLTSFCLYFPMPAYVYENDNWIQNKDHNLICSGPFKLKKWENNSSISIEKNPSFYDRDKIKIDEVIINIIPNEETAFQMYEKNALDFISSFLSPIPIDYLGSITKRTDANLFSLGGSSFCAFNMDKFPFNNLNMRKAFLYAINRKSLVDNISQLGEEIANRCLPSVLAFNKDIRLFEDNQIKLAQNHFAKALKELNISKENLEITFSYGSYIVHKKEAEALKQMWDETFGINVKLKLSEEKTHLSDLHKRNFQIGLGRYLVHYNDPMNIFERFKYKNHPKNFSNFEDENFINILDKSLEITDNEKRQHLLEEAEKYFIDQAVIAPMYHYKYTLLCKPHIKGIYINPIGDLFLEEAYINKE